MKTKTLDFRRCAKNMFAATVLTGTKFLGVGHANSNPGNEPFQYLHRQDPADRTIWGDLYEIARDVKHGVEFVVSEGYSAIPGGWKTIAAGCLLVFGAWVLQEEFGHWHQKQYSPSGGRRAMRKPRTRAAAEEVAGPTSSLEPSAPTSPADTSSAEGSVLPSSPEGEEIPGETANIVPPPASPVPAEGPPSNPLGRRLPVGRNSTSTVINQWKEQQRRHRQP